MRRCNHCEESREVRLLPDSGTYAELPPSKLPHLDYLEIIPCPECTVECSSCREHVVDEDVRDGICADCDGTDERTALEAASTTERGCLDHERDQRLGSER